MHRYELDLIDNIVLDMDNFPLFDPAAFHSLATGINTIYGTIKAKENEINASLPPGIIPLDIALDSFTREFFDCASHWFSLSLVNYVRLIGLVDVLNCNQWTTADIAQNKRNAKVVKDHCREYVLRVIPNIVRWRNKVSAHFAITDPFPDDNIATLELSTMNTMRFMSGHFYIGAIVLGTSEVESELPKWSVVEEYERLAPRYFPNLVV